MIEHRYHTYKQETRSSPSFHDNIMMTCAWVRYKTIKLGIIMHYNENWKWGWHPRQACGRIYVYEINKALNFDLKHTQPRIISKHSHSKLALYYFMQKMLHCLFHSEIYQWFVSLLLKIKDLYKVCKTHAHIWSWSTQTQRTSSQPISLSFQPHTTHCFGICIIWHLDLNSSTEHNQAIVQENECVQKQRIMGQEIISFTVKVYLNCIPNIFSLYCGISSNSWYLVLHAFKF
jgi:hypothetical protein